MGGDVPQMVNHCTVFNDRWLDAVNRELNSIKENETWIEIDKPNNAKILDTKWVFTYKDLEKKNEFKYKARLVVRGFQQDRNRSFDDIYSPVARMVTINAFLIISNQ